MKTESRRGHALPKGAAGDGHPVLRPVLRANANREPALRVRAHRQRDPDRVGGAGAREIGLALMPRKPKRNPPKASNLALQILSKMVVSACQRRGMAIFIDKKGATHLVRYAPYFVALDTSPH